MAPVQGTRVVWLALGCLGMTCAASGCGSAWEDADAQLVWAALESAQLVRPINLAHIRQKVATNAPVHCPEGGTGDSSMVHTHAWAKTEDGADGEATGHIVYTLKSCKTASGVAVSGRLRRVFHAVQRLPFELGYATVPGSSRVTEEYFGTLELSERLHGRCEVELTRVHLNGELSYNGSVCGRDAAQILMQGTSKE